MRSETRKREYSTKGFEEGDVLVISIVNPGNNEWLHVGGEREVLSRSSSSKKTKQDNTPLLSAKAIPGGICSICLEEVKKESRLRLLRCGHAFHCRCIERWLGSVNRCPLCNSTAVDRPTFSVAEDIGSVKLLPLPRFSGVSVARTSAQGEDDDEEAGGRSEEGRLSSMYRDGNQHMVEYVDESFHFFWEREMQSFTKDGRILSKQLYRKYIQLIYRSKLFSEDTKARMVALTRHGFRYGVPVDCNSSVVPTRKYSLEESIRRERTLELLESLHRSSPSDDRTTEEEFTPVFPKDGDDNTSEDVIISKKLRLGLYEDDFAVFEEEEEEQQYMLEGDELIRALLRKFIFNLVHFTTLRHDRKTLVGAIRRNKLLNEGMKSPFVCMDKCMDILNRELGTSFYSKVIKRNS
ncbi:hypothetical protein Gasu2_17370 [Galdieria sulphuraria]|nr:hypothetical protein Gasu2_17370 [Galdieria sulphuraria]